MRSSSCFVAAALFACVLASSAQSALKPAPTVAATPPMGWNSWNFFAEKVTEQDIKNAADQMVATGMRDAGYVYINIDDTWEGERDAQGVLHPNAKFPDMKGLADYVHARGLKLGIYSGPGAKTCGGYTASLGHEEQDAKMYAAWGVDYLKYDLCSFREDVMYPKALHDKPEQARLMIAAYDKMGKALESSGRPIVYSLCQYGWDSVWEWGASVGGNLWRTTGDVEANWPSIYNIISEQAGLAKYSGPGHWNDPDMLEVGNGRLTLEENRAHFSMWAMLAAPLLAGNDLPKMKPEIKAILTNKDVIAIDQDPLGQQARRVYTDGEVEVWTRPLAGGAEALAVLNAGPERVATHPFHLPLAALDLHAGPAKDLWTGKTIVLQENMPVELKRHDILLLRIPAAQ